MGCGVSVDLRQLDSVELVALCARNLQDSHLWSEFVRRFTPRIRQFISGSVRYSERCGDSVYGPSRLIDEAQMKDLFQSTIVRLVENDCDALKRFSGSSESDLLAYFAVITRSVVRDYLRRQRATKRPVALPADRYSGICPSEQPSSNSLDRDVLGREVVRLSERTIRSLSGESSARDLLIFQLYYYDDLSTGQIAQCKGIGLTKPGVEKVLNRLKERVRMLLSSDRSEAMMR